MLSLREPRNRSPKRDPPSTHLAARLLKFRKANRLPSTYGPRRFTGLHGVCNGTRGEVVVPRDRVFPEPSGGGLLRLG